MRTAYTPQVIYPTPMDQREMDKWAAWCNSTPWGTHSPAPTPTPQSRHTGTQTRREHHPHGHPASSSAQPSVPVSATRRSGKRDHTSGPTPIPTPTPIPGNRKGTQAHGAPGVSTLLPPAPSLHSHAFSVRQCCLCDLRQTPAPTRRHHRSHLSLAGRTTEALRVYLRSVSTHHQANWLSAPPNPMCPT